MADSSDFSEFVKTRRSVRAFEDKEVPDDLLRAVLDDAKWAPSWCNTHPYFIAVARGERKERIRHNLCRLYDRAVEAKSLVSQVGLWASGGAPDGDYNVMLKYPAHLQKHRIDCAKGLYGLMGVERYVHIYLTKHIRTRIFEYNIPLLIYSYSHKLIYVHIHTTIHANMHAFIHAYMMAHSQPHRQPL